MIEKFVELIPKELMNQSEAVLFLGRNAFLGQKGRKDREHIAIVTPNLKRADRINPDTDLIPEVAVSDSRKISPTSIHCQKLKDSIIKYNPKTVVLLHTKVLKSFLNYLGHITSKSNSGKVGKLIDGTEACFFNIAFPHGNSISSYEKVQRYRELKEYLIKSLK